MRLLVLAHFQDGSSKEQINRFFVVRIWFDFYIF